VRDRLLPYGRQSIDEEDVAAVVDVLRSDLVTQGPKVAEFEQAVACYCGAEYAVALSSGTAALHAACLTAGLGPGDEAITCPITFVATANAVVYCGAAPVFADARADTINIDPAAVEAKITSKTKAVLPIDFAGHPADLHVIAEIARRHQLVVIEDASHALGATYVEQRVGALSDMTVFSFHPVKHITTGEGGIVLTNNRDYYQRLKLFREHGIVRHVDSARPWYYEMTRLGYNYRITDFQCALGLSQMRKLDAFLERRRRIAAVYDDAFDGMDCLVRPVELDNCRSAYHIYPVRLSGNLAKVGRATIYQALRAENIGVNVHYLPVHLHPFYKTRFGYKRGDFPVAEHYYDSAITLPLFPGMSDRDVQDVIDAVLKVAQYFQKAG